MNKMRRSTKTTTPGVTLAPRLVPPDALFPVAIPSSISPNGQFSRLITLFRHARDSYPVTPRYSVPNLLQRANNQSP